MRGGASAARALDTAPTRAFDNRFGAYPIRLLPGETRTTDRPDEMIVTVLGSCVAACIRNPRTGFGGMNHFMLPESSTGDWSGASASLRYGNYAMEALINDVLKSGCAREDLEIKLFGGSNLSDGPAMVGRKNSEFALRYLEEEGLRLAAQDLGGPVGRRIHYFPATGKVQRLLLKPASAKAIADDENRYRRTLKHTPVGGDVDLFE